jgi:hypothetical protein
LAADRRELNGDRDLIDLCVLNGDRDLIIDRTFRVDLEFSILHGGFAGFAG